MVQSQRIRSSDEAAHDFIVRNQTKREELHGQSFASAAPPHGSSVKITSLNQIPFSEHPHGRRHECWQLRMMSFVCFSQLRVFNQVTVSGVRLTIRRPELLQPLVMTTDDLLCIAR